MTREKYMQAVACLGTRPHRVAGDDLTPLEHIALIIGTLASIASLVAVSLQMKLSHRSKR